MNQVVDLRRPGARSHHPTLSPSSLPAIMQCACYTGRGESDDDAEKGQALHDYTMDLVSGKPPAGKVSSDEKNACEWGTNEVRFLFEQYAPGEKIMMEEKLVVKDGAGRIISSGYADFNGGSLVIDLKSGLDWRPDLHWYKPQLADYALARMQTTGLDRIFCVELYLMPNRKRTYWITRGEAEGYLAAAIARRRNPDKKPLMNDYCKWCGRLIWCPAINRLAWRTVELYARANGMEELFACPEKIGCPETMAQALTIAKKILKPLCDRIESAAVTFSEDHEMPYYVRDRSKPREKIVDVRAAFNRLPFDSAEFSRALSTTPKQVAEVYAEKFGVPVKNARYTINGLLGDLIVSGESNPTLKHLMDNQKRKRNG